MKMSAKTAALALGVATLSAATVLPAAAEDFAIRPGCGGTLVGRSGCGNTGGSPNSASVGSAASTAPSGSVDIDGGGSVQIPNHLNNEYTRDGTRYGTDGYGNYWSITDNGRGGGSVMIMTPEGDSNQSVITGAWGTTSGNGGSGGKGHSAPSRPLPNKSESAPTAPVSANVFGGAVNASSLAVSNASLDHQVGKTAPAPKKPVPLRIISASTQAQSTAQQLVAHPQPLGPVGSSSMNARQKALSAGSH